MVIPFCYSNTFSRSRTLVLFNYIFSYSSTLIQTRHLKNVLQQETYYFALPIVQEGSYRKMQPLFSTAFESYCVIVYTSRKSPAQNLQRISLQIFPFIIRLLTNLYFSFPCFDTKNKIHRLLLNTDTICFKLNFLK